MKWIIIGLFLLIACPLSAQIEEQLDLAWSYYKKVETTINKKAYQEFDTYLQKSEKIYTKLEAYDIFIRDLVYVTSKLNKDQQYDKTISFLDNYFHKIPKTLPYQPALLQNFYFNIGKAYLYTNQQEKAILYYDKSIIVNWNRYGKTSTQSAGQLIAIGDDFLDIKQYEKAIEYYKKAENILNQPYFFQNRNLEKTYKQLIICYDKSEKKDRVIHYKNLLSEVTKNINYEKEIKTLSRNINTTRRKQDFDSLKIYADSMRTYFVKSKQWYQYTSVFNKLGAQLLAENYSLAKFFLEEVLTVAKENLNEEHFQIALTYGYLGEYYEEYEGNYDKAIKYATKSLNLLTKITGEQSRDVSLCYNVIGLRLDYKGNYEHALQYHQKALKIRLKMGEGWAIGQSYKNIARCYEGKGDYKKAIEFYKKAEKTWLFAATGRYFLYMGYQNLGRCYNKIGAYDTATTVLNKALDYLQEKDGHHHSYYALRSIKSLGDAYGGLNQSQKQLVFYQKAAKIAAILFKEQNPDNASIYRALGDFYKKEKVYNTALEYYQKALIALSGTLQQVTIYQNPGLETVHSQIPYLQILIAKADVLKTIYTENNNLEQLENALITYQFAVRVLQQIRSQFNGHQSQITLLQNYKTVYDKSIATAAMLYEQTGKKEYVEKAFLLSEQSKANGLLSAYNRWNSQLDLTKDSLLLENYQRLEGQLLSYEFSDKISTDSILLFTNQLDSLKNVILKKYPNFYLPKFANLEAVQQHLTQQYQKETALIEFYRGEKLCYQFVITQSAILLYQYDLDDLLPKIQNLVDALHQPHTFNYLTPSFVLYQQLFEQPLRRLRQNKYVQRLTIIPDGELYFVPFEVLISREPSPKSLHPAFLLENYAITYDYSATLLLEKYKLSHTKKARRKFAAFSPSFSKNQTDCQGQALDDLSSYHQMVLKLAASSGKSYVGSKATKKRFLKAGQRFQVLFLYTHACADIENPAKNTLFFSGDQLTSPELYQHQFQSDLLILCGCETALGRVDYSEGMMGLTHGFTYNGIPSIVSTLWKMNTLSSSVLMDNFMIQLRKGKSKDEALRQAKLNYLQQAIDEDKHPYYWAGLVHFGNTEPVEKRVRLWWFLALGLILLFGVVWWKRKNH